LEKDDLLFYFQRNVKNAACFGSLNVTSMNQPAPYFFQLATHPLPVKSKPLGVDSLCKEDPMLSLNQSSTSQLAYALKRAPSFMDVVCYSGTGSATNITHNLGVAP
jgi:hypothetical protein